MQKMNLNNRWVLLTGASSGLGEAMAHEMAKEYRANIILVARRVEKLNEIKKDLESEYGIQCEVMPADMTDPEAVDNLFQQATQKYEIYGVVLNAGVTYYGKHSELAWEQYQQIIATNLDSVMRLTHLSLNYFLEKDNGGAIMLVTSMAGLIPVPYQAAYSGTKAFLTQFGQSLSLEIAKENVSITTYAPGGIATEMTQNSGLEDIFGDSPFLQSAESCARMALQAMVNRKRLAVPGLMNRLQLFLTRLVPRALVLNILANAYQRGV